MPRIAHKALAMAVLVAACMLAGCSGGVPELDHAAKVGSMTAMVPSSYAEDAIEDDLTYTDPHDSDRYISIVFDGDSDESVEQIEERELFPWSSEFDGGDGELEPDVIDFGELDGREYEAVQATCDDEPAAIGGETLRFVFISAPEGAYTVTIVNDDVDIADFIGALSFE